MNRLIKSSQIFLTGLLLTGCGHLNACRPELEGTNREVPFRGAVYFHERVCSPVARSTHILELDLDDQDLRLEVTQGDSSAGMEYRAAVTSRYLEVAGWLAAVNGGYFEPFASGSEGGEDYYPQAGDPVNVIGASIWRGQLVSREELTSDRRIDSIICIHGRDVWIENGQHCTGAVDYALSAGPRLLAGGTPLTIDIEDAGGKRLPRTAFGLDIRGRRAWFVVVDGRQPGFSRGISHRELTDLFRALGATDAITLDGGGSATMVLSRMTGSQVVNSPIHTHIPGKERPVANHLGVRGHRLDPVD